MEFSDFQSITLKDPLAFERVEDSLVEDMTSEKIQKLLDAYGFEVDDLQTIFVGLRFSSNQQCNLNWALKDMKIKHRIPIKDVLLYFEKFNSIEKIITILDGDTLRVLRRELVRFCPSAYKKEV